MQKESKSLKKGINKNKALTSFACVKVTSATASRLCTTLSL